MSYNTKYEEVFEVIIKTIDISPGNCGLYNRKVKSLM